MAKTIFKMADGIITAWLWHDHDINFARWLHPVMWHVALGSWQWIHQVHGSTMQCDTWLWDDMPLNSPRGSTLQCRRLLWDDMSRKSPKRSPYWNSTSGFDFDHITAVDMSFCTSLRDFIQIGPPSAEKNDVMSIFKMAHLSHLGFQGSNNGFFEKPM